MDAAEHPEDHSEDESHGHGQQRGQQAVKDEFDQLKHGVASYPHSVEAVCGEGLRDDIFETDLSDHTSQRRTMSSENNQHRQGGDLEMMDTRARSDFQVFTLQITNLTVCYMNTMTSHYLITCNNTNNST